MSGTVAAKITALITLQAQAKTSAQNLKGHSVKSRLIYCQVPVNKSIKVFYQQFQELCLIHRDRHWFRQVWIFGQS